MGYRHGLRCLACFDDISIAAFAREVDSRRRVAWQPPHRAQLASPSPRADLDIVTWPRPSAQGRLANSEGHEPGARARGTAIHAWFLDRMTYIQKVVVTSIHRADTLHLHQRSSVITTGALGPMLGQAAGEGDLRMTCKLLQVDISGRLWIRTRDPSLIRTVL